MSTTIGIGYSTKDGDCFDELKALAERYGYGLANGLEAVESDARLGLKTCMAIKEWNSLAILRAPTNSTANLAFEIDEEMTDRDFKGTEPKFFGFLENLNKICIDKCSKLGVFFSGEWYEKDHARMSYGTMSNLITLLKMPGHWCLLFLIPETGHTRSSDEIPLVYDVTLD